MMMYFWNKKGPQSMTTGALGKRLKSKVKLNKDFCTTGKRPKINKDFLYKSNINKRPFLVRK